MYVCMEELLKRGVLWGHIFRSFSRRGITILKKCNLIHSDNGKSRLFLDFLGANRPKITFYNSFCPSIF